MITEDRDDGWPRCGDPACDTCWLLGPITDAWKARVRALLADASPFAGTGDRP